MGSKRQNRFLSAHVYRLLSYPLHTFNKHSKRVPPVGVHARFSYFSGRNVALRSKMLGDRYRTKFHQTFTRLSPAIRPRTAPAQK